MEFEDLSDLFFSDAELAKDDEKKILTETYWPRQIGSIVKYIEPIDIDDSLSSADKLFKDDAELTAIPVKENGKVIGVIERKDSENTTKEAMRNFNTTSVNFFSRTGSSDFSVSNYVHRLDDAVVMLDANDYIMTNLQKVTDINKKYGISAFLVFDSKNDDKNFLGIANLNNFLSRISEIREQDLRKASIVQKYQSPINEQLSELSYKITSYNRLSNSLGGDTYQAVSINDKESFVALFDTSEENIAASLLSMAISSFFKMHKDNQQFSNKPTTFVSTLDKFLASVIPTGSFITGIICYFNTAQNIIYIYNCRHTVAYILYQGTDISTKIAEIAPSLPPFGNGRISEIISKKYEKTDRPFTVIKLQPKIHINLYSDGLINMHNKKFEIFGEDKVKSLFNSLYACSVPEMEEKIKNVVNNFTAETVIPDDITVVDIRL